MPVLSRILLLSRPLIGSPPHGGGDLLAAHHGVTSEDKQEVNTNGWKLGLLN